MPDEFWDELDLDEAAPAPVAKKQAAPAPIPAVPKKAALPGASPAAPPAPGVPGQDPQGAAPMSKNPQVPDLPKMPKMPAGMQLPEFKGSKHSTDDILDKYFELLQRADTQEDELSLNAILSIAEKYLAAAELVGKNEVAVEQAKFQAQFDLINNAQKIAQQDAAHKQQMAHNDVLNKQKVTQNVDFHKQKLAHQTDAHKIRLDAQKKSIATKQAAKKVAAPAKKAAPKLPGNPNVPTP